MNKYCSAIYSDAYGQECVDIEMEDDGQFLAMTLRGIHFRGLSFDSFYIWPIDQNIEELQNFHLRKERIIFGNSIKLNCQMLTGYKLQWTMSLPVVKQNQIIAGTLQGTYAEEIPSGKTSWAFRLQVEETLLTVTDDHLNTEQAIEQLQQQLPQDIYIKCCQFCALSTYEPFSGEGRLCFKNKKEQIREIKYQPQPRSKIRINALRNEGGVNYVQEIYLCPEFEVDLRWLNIVRQAAE